MTTPYPSTLREAVAAHNRHARTGDGLSWLPERSPAARTRVWIVVRLVGGSGHPQRLGPVTPVEAVALVVALVAGRMLHVPAGGGQVVHIPAGRIDHMNTVEEPAEVTP